MIEIFAAVSEVRKTGIIYKVKGGIVPTEQGDFFSIRAPLPKNKKERELLTGILKPYFGKLLLPHSFKALDDLKGAEYNTLHFENRVLISAFLEYCESTRPRSVLISGSSYLRPEFFARISHYTDHITLPNTEYDPDLCKGMLNISGTPLVFGEEAENTSAALILKKYAGYSAPINCAVFEKRIFEKIRWTGNGIIPYELKDFDPFKTSAAMFFEWGVKNASDFWKMLVIKENMIYNII